MRKAVRAVMVTVLIVFGFAAVCWGQPQPVRVSQPVYGGMEFYVCQPSWAPSGWYMTYDGYPVMQGQGGVWYYGIPSGQAVVPSSYVVGSVVPSQVALAPFPQFMAVPRVRVQTFWLQDARFVRVAKWDRLVDRMGILEKPRVPLAWKGDTPSCVFAWTGRDWYKMSAMMEGDESPGQILSRYRETLESFVRQNGFVWNDADTPSLANQAAVWGYLWMGRMAPLNMW